jgi:hypothetical protein
VPVAASTQVLEKFELGVSDSLLEGYSDELYPLSGPIASPIVGNFTFSCTGAIIMSK